MNKQMNYPEQLNLTHKSMIKVNKALLSLTEAMKELKVNNPQLFKAVKEALHKASE